MDASGHSGFFSVTELAGELGVTPRTLRFYEDKGLLQPQRAGNSRVYTHRDRGRMILILRGKRLGFSLNEIREWLDLYDSDPGQTAQMRALMAKAAERLEGLRRQREDIDATIRELEDIVGAAERHLEAGGAGKQA